MHASDTGPSPLRAPAARLSIRRVPVRRALGWLAAGWADCRRTPAPLAVASIVLLILAVFASRVASWLPILLLPPYLGTVAAYLRMADRGQVFLSGSGAWRSARLWSVGIGLLLLGAVLNGGLALFVLSTLGPAIRTSMPVVGAVVALIFLVRLLVVPVLAICWLAPALVVNRDAGVLQALRLSMAGSWRNAGAFLGTALAAAVLLMLATVPLGLGLVVALPVLACAAVRAADEIVVDAA